MSAAATRTAADRQAERPTTWWAMWLFVATESALFAVLASSYLYLRFQASSWPPAGIEAPTFTLPAVGLACLVASSVATVLAVRSGTIGRSVLLLAGAVLLGCGFVVAQWLDLREAVDVSDPRESAYGSSIVTLGGMHAAHAVLGVALLVWAAARRIATGEAATTVRICALYWQFVVVVGVVLFLLVTLSLRL